MDCTIYNSSEKNSDVFQIEALLWKMNVLNLNGKYWLPFNYYLEKKDKLLSC